MSKDKQNVEKNWTEDFVQENGNYENICSQCSEHFRGNKYRRVCKQCAIKDPEQHLDFIDGSTYSIPKEPEKEVDIEALAINYATNLNSWGEKFVSLVEKLAFMEGYNACLSSLNQKKWNKF